MNGMADGEQTRVVVPGAVHTRRLAVLMITGLAARALLPFPWTAIALLPLGYGVLEGIRAVRAMRDAEAGTVTQLWASVGVALLVMMSLIVLLPFVTFGSSLDYQQCVDGANTSVARAECREGLLTPLGAG